MIDAVLRRREFVERPPVLVDIGAAGAVRPVWRKLARYSVAVAFDADARDFPTKQESPYRELHLVNALVSDREHPNARFHLTKSPHCSSLLTPRRESLSDYAFADFFAIEEVLELPVVALRSALLDRGFDYVDWFKTDSQGTDLRLFRSLGEHVTRATIVAEFEPGIIDAYEGEDKLHEVLRYMNTLGAHWLAEFTPKGSHRVRPEYLDELSQSKLYRKLIESSLPMTPDWGELTYVNSFAEIKSWDLRSLLLGWVFGTILNQHGFALDIARRARSAFTDSMLPKMEEWSKRMLRRGVLMLRFSAAALNKMRRLTRDRA